MYKRLLSLLSTFLMLGALIAGTANVYATVAASPSIQTFTAGALSVELKDLEGDPLSGPFMTADHMAPGDTEVYDATLTNDGPYSVRYALGFQRTDLVQVNSGDQATRNDALADALWLMVERLIGPDPSNPQDWSLLGTHTLTEWTASLKTDPLQVIASGGSQRFRFSAELPLEAENPAQAGTVSTALLIFSEEIRPTTSPPTPESPNFTLTKHVGTDPLVDSGQDLLTFDQQSGTAYFHYSVVNTGNIPFTITSAVDDTVGPVTFSPLTLMPGETAKAVVSKAYSLLPDGAPPQTEVGVVTVKAGDLTKTAQASVRRIAKQVEPPGSPPETPPASQPPTTPKPLQTGSLLVRVLDNSQRSQGQVAPVPGATVRLSNGLMGMTDGHGQVLFANLLPGFLAASAWSVDPLNPLPVTRVEGHAEATLTATEPNQVITILLSWPDLPAAGPGVAVSTGALTGRVCSPKAPGAQVKVVGPDGQSDAVTIAPNGSLGQWRPWGLRDLAPGTWTLTLITPSGEQVEQKVQVDAGLSTTAKDFSLACTGEPGNKVLPIAGVSLMLGGVAVLVWRRRPRRNQIT
jgi:hypothetical protein